MVKFVKDIVESLATVARGMSITAKYMRKKPVTLPWLRAQRRAALHVVHAVRQGLPGGLHLHRDGGQG